MIELEIYKLANGGVFEMLKRRWKIEVIDLAQSILCMTPRKHGNQQVIQCKVGKAAHWRRVHTYVIQECCDGCGKYALTRQMFDRVRVG